MSDTLEPEPKLPGSKRTEKLLRMLQSMSQRYPAAKVDKWKAGFGVLLADGRSLHTVIDGSWTPEEQRDWLALFAAWLAVDPEGLAPEHATLGGQFARVKERWPRSNGPAAS